MANLDPNRLKNLHRYWQAANYLTIGQIYLQDNPLLRESLRPEHIKPRLLGHWGTLPGLSFIYVHLNRRGKGEGFRESRTALGFQAAGANLGQRQQMLPGSSKYSWSSLGPPSLVGNILSCCKNYLFLDSHLTGTFPSLKNGYVYPDVHL